ncbi:MAG TPA: isoprenylcysteine carboxylmethyltransferase family protein [Tepidiformaceae bacterium]|nr:isoprenylcysteine carboxylmethyltransferase family protein [Tepidiformaceae bacterium]
MASDAREGELSRRTFPAMVALHCSVIGATALWGGRTRWRWLAVLAAAQPVRAWVLTTLGPRWNARAAVSPTMEVETRGPYAHIRHPNYAVVFVELLALPLAFGLRRLAWGAAVAHAVILTVRVRDEEALLAEMPGYDEHFRTKKRFVPGVF